MSSDPHTSRSLPAQVNLEQQKKQARELLRAVKAHESAAFERFRAHHPRFTGKSDHEMERASLALHDAQLVLAREYGFPHWAALKHEIESRTGGAHTRIFVTDVEYFDDRAGGLVSAHQGGVAHAFEQIRQWHPAFADASDDELARAPFDLEAARVVYARQHGSATWDAFVADLRAVASGERTEPFKEAFEALQRAEWDRLRQLIRQHPDVLRARGTNGNTMLNLAVSLAGRTCDPLPSQAWQLLECSYGRVPTSIRQTISVGHPCTRRRTPTRWSSRHVSSTLAQHSTLMRTVRGAHRWPSRCSGDTARLPMHSPPGWSCRET